MKYVIDTSALAKVFLAEADREKAVGLLTSSIRREIELHAPSLLLYEMNNVLVSNEITGRAYDDVIRFLFAWIKAGVLLVHEVDEDLLRRTEAIASIDTQGQGHISSFDATFHALAIRLGAQFVTADKAYVRKTSVLVGHVVELASIP